MTPFSRIMGARPTFRCRSDPSCFITMRNSLLTSGSRARGSPSTGAATSAVAIPGSLRNVGQSLIRRRADQAYRDAALSQVLLGGADPVFIVMEDAGGQGRVSPAFGEHAVQVL